MVNAQGRLCRFEVDFYARTRAKAVGDRDVLSLNMQNPKDKPNLLTALPLLLILFPGAPYD